MARAREGFRCACKLVSRSCSDARVDLRASIRVERLRGCQRSVQTNLRCVWCFRCEVSYYSVPSASSVAAQLKVHALWRRRGTSGIDRHLLCGRARAHHRSSARFSFYNGDKIAGAIHEQAVSPSAEHRGRGFVCRLWSKRQDATCKGACQLSDQRGTQRRFFADSFTSRGRKMHSH